VESLPILSHITNIKHWRKITCVKQHNILTCAAPVQRFCSHRSLCQRSDCTRKWDVLFCLTNSDKIIKLVFLVSFFRPPLRSTCYFVKLYKAFRGKLRAMFPLEKYPFHHLHGLLKFQTVTKKKDFHGLTMVEVWKCTIISLYLKKLEDKKIYFNKVGAQLCSAVFRVIQKHMGVLQQVGCWNKWQNVCD